MENFQSVRKYIEKPCTLIFISRRLYLFKYKYVKYSINNLVIPYFFNIFAMVCY